MRYDKGAVKFLPLLHQEMDAALWTLARRACRTTQDAPPRVFLFLCSTPPSPIPFTRLPSTGTPPPVGIHLNRTRADSTLLGVSVITTLESPSSAERLGCLLVTDQ